MTRTDEESAEAAPKIAIPPAPTPHVADRAVAGDARPAAPTRELWARLAASPQRAILLDYDGTLAPFRVDRAKARPSPGVVPVLRRLLGTPGVSVAIVTGRPADEVARLLGGLPIEVFGAHGWERRLPDGALERTLLSPDQSRGLDDAERAVASPLLGKRVERKYASLAVHTRGLREEHARDVEALARRAFAAVVRRAALEVRGFDGGVELRATGVHKGTAVRRILEGLRPAGVAIYLGDDLTDEDAFAAVAERGAGILVRRHDRPTRAEFRLDGQAAVVGFLERVVSLAAGPAAGRPTRRRPAGARLVVVSNRLPEVARHGTLEARRTASVGGLVSALAPALERAPGSIWCGWSGRSVAAAQGGRTTRERSGAVEMLGIDLAERDVEEHYLGFCNAALWPLLHSFTGRVVAAPAQHAAYRRVNALFARVLSRRLGAGDRVWVHDYHLLPLGYELRRRGFAGRLGFFLHVPFPPWEVLELLPWAREVLEHLLAYDVVGFHTRTYASNYARAVEEELGAAPPQDGWLEAEGRTQRVGAYPIGIDPGPYRLWARQDAARRRGRRLREILSGRKIILGVDRLDYTKGIPERLRAFGRLLEIAPRLRRRVCFIQISAPSRTRIPEYVRQRREVEELVGHINGRFGEEDWVPVRYLFRAYSQRDLAAFYREADVCLVSPLRDGMNLVAKEYVAAQQGDPGVLVLSRFAGAAKELEEAMIVNPLDIDGTAAALARALALPLEERARRQALLLRRVESWTAAHWAEAFTRDLAEGAA